MKVLAIDIGGTRVKFLATGQQQRRTFDSGPDLTPKQMVDGVRKHTADWDYDVVSIGYPGHVHLGQPAEEPCNLGKGWVGFDYGAAFGRPVKIMNDAAMQALGSYKGGTMFFLGLGTGLGSALIAEGAVVPIQMAQLYITKTSTFEDHVGKKGLKKYGKKKWRGYVAFLLRRLNAAFHPDDMVVGGGNAQKVKELPPNCRIGTNANAFIGGFRMWGEETGQQAPGRPALVPRQRGRRKAS